MNRTRIRHLGFNPGVDRRLRDQREGSFERATQAARNASRWSWGKPVRTTADALVAARWIFLEAARETGRTGVFATLAREVAYHKRDVPPARILQYILDETSHKAPEAAAKARKLLGGPFAPSKLPGGAMGPEKPTPGGRPGPPKPPPPPPGLFARIARWFRGRNKAV